MKVVKVDHLGIAVKSIEEAKKLYHDILGLPMAGSETVAEQKVTTAFFPCGDTEVELLESTAPDGPIAKFIEANKGTIAVESEVGRGSIFSFSLPVAAKE